jgi:O-antigen/teichoic acid export membrane protein
MAASFVILRWIDPKEYGIWQSLLVINSYLILVQSGVINGLNRELPYVMGKGDQKAIIELAASAQGFAFIISGFLVIAAAGIPLIIEDKRIGWTMAGIVLVAAISIVRNYLFSTYRAGRAFDVLTRINLFESAAGIVTIPLVYYFGYAGLVCRVVFLQIAGLIVSYIWRPLKVSSQCRIKPLIKLLKVGGPIFSLSYLFGIADTFPKLILIKYSGPELVGLFAPALALTSFYTMLPAVVARYIYPQMSYQLGKYDDNPISIWPTAWKSAGGAVIAGIPFMIIGFLVIDPMISYFFPKYAEAIPATYWCLAAGLFLGPRIAVNALFALKAWKWATIYTIIFVISNFLFPWLGFLNNSKPLVGLAMGICLSYLVIFIGAMVCIYQATHLKKEI